LLIRDNGKGFDITQETVGNGLKNMKNRAMEMGATFLIESEPGRGTTIQLLIKAA
jgi:signal transduction histidine kinase